MLPQPVCVTDRQSTLAMQFRQTFGREALLLDGDDGYDLIPLLPGENENAGCIYIYWEERDTRLTCRVSSDQWLLENGAGRSVIDVVLPFFVSFLVSASRRSRRAPLRASWLTQVALNSARRQIPETRMGPHLVVVAAPLLDADLGVDAIPEPLQREMLVAELAVERFVGAILPWLARIDERRLDLGALRATAGSRAPRTPVRCPSAGSAARRGRSPAA